MSNLSKTKSVQEGEVLATTLNMDASLALDEDAILVRRHLNGDPVAFERLYQKYYPKAVSVARGILLNADDAADAAQEIFALVYRNMHKFDQRSKFSTWLFRIAINRSIQESRKMRIRRNTVELDPSLAADPQYDAPPPEDPAIEEALRKLHPSDRALITMFYWQEMPLNEIADALGCRVNAAKTRLYRARERFKVEYERVTA